MTPERAASINTRMTLAWAIREGLSAAPMPDLADVSLNDATEAALMRNSGVDPGRVRAMLGWWMMQVVR